MESNKSFISHFDATNTEAWLSKIDADLKGKSRTTLVNQYGDVRLDPFANFEDISLCPQNTLQLNENWLVAERFEITEPKTTNRILLEALQNGVSAPILKINTSVTYEDLVQTFENVEHQYIHTYFQCDEPTQIEPLKDYISSQKEAFWGFLVPNNKEAVGTKSITIFDKGDSLTGDDLTIYLADLLEKLKGQIDLGVEIDKIQFRLHAHSHFLLNIGILRAFKTLFKNLLKAHNLPYDKDPWIIVKWDVTNSDSNHNLICNTAVAVSSLLGGAIILDIPLAGNEAKKRSFYQRMNRNLLHLMTMESHLNAYKDAVEGSYFFEDLTNQLVTKSWNSFLGHV